MLTVIAVMTIMRVTMTTAAPKVMTIMRVTMTTAAPKVMMNKMFNVSKDRNLVLTECGFWLLQGYRAGIIGI